MGNWTFNILVRLIELGCFMVANMFAWVSILFYQFPSHLLDWKSSIDRQFFANVFPLRPRFFFFSLTSTQVKWILSSGTSQVLRRWRTWRAPAFSCECASCYYCCSWRISSGLRRGCNRWKPNLSVSSLDRDECEYIYHWRREKGEDKKRKDCRMRLGGRQRAEPACWGSGVVQESSGFLTIIDGIAPNWIGLLLLVFLTLEMASSCVGGAKLFD